VRDEGCGRIPEEILDFGFDIDYQLLSRIHTSYICIGTEVSTHRNILNFKFERQEMALDRITANPKQVNGQPCIRRMRITVRRVLEALAVYADRNDLKREYPEIEDEDIK
jgi:uncharacterized protein (DUF433 family)